MSNQPTSPLRLFYSYCHKDERFRSSLETALALLKNNGLIKDWSDHNILPGQRISDAIRKEMGQADIFAFLFSQNFIASEECTKEWERVKRLPTNGGARFRIPVILSPCAWRDVLGDDDVKALPTDGKSVSSYADQATAWQEIYEGIKAITTEIRKNFAVKTDFMRSVKQTELLSQNYIDLDDIFVFLALSRFRPGTSSSNQLMEERVTNAQQLLAVGNCLIHGDDMSGKTALARHLFVRLVDESRPVLFVDLKEVRGLPSDQVVREIYGQEFNGDYTLWREQSDKTIVLDNLTSAPNAIKFLTFAAKMFDRVIVTLASDIYSSFFRDDVRMAGFKIMTMEPMTHGQQESLIRKRLSLMGHSSVKDGFVDQVEDRVNGIIDKGVVPRYPFYVLSVIQTYEGFMPSDLSITSYGHCYYVWILARLIKAGIARRDEDINVCLNFAERLAFRIYQCKEVNGKEFTRAEFKEFVKEYRDSYIMRESILNRLMDREYGILSDDGCFRVSYMHYFFLGLFLSKAGEQQNGVVERLCDRSYVTANHLTLLFVIHHATSDDVLDTILVMTMCALGGVEPATLSNEETARFREIVAGLTNRLLPNDEVPEERKKVRELRDVGEHAVVDEVEGVEGEDGPVGAVNDAYRILRNNRILGEVLRNKYGKLRKDRVEEIVETVADGGLRLANWVLRDEDEIAEWAQYVKARNPKASVEQVKWILRFLAFAWTMVNVENVVSSVRHPEIREVVKDVVRKRNSPAYDIVGYFSALDSAEELTEATSKYLETLLKKHTDPFVKGVLSMRTQHYMNTHRSRASVEQKVCSLLDVSYRHRLGSKG